jgi:hypothetical protein
VGLLALLLAQPQVAENLQGKVLLAIIMSLLQIVMFAVLSGDRIARVWSAVFGLPAFVAVMASVTAPGHLRDSIAIWAHALAALFFVITFALILRYVLMHEVIFDNVVGALVAYLMIGVAMGQVYVLLEVNYPESFHASENIGDALHNTHSRGAALTYFSFATLTTSGYGDIVPAKPLSRTLAWMEAVAGQFYIAVLVAGMVGIRVSRSSFALPPEKT